MTLTEALGYGAATLTTASFIPQARLIWKTRHADGLSVGMYSMFVAGVALWLGYGLMLGAWPVIIANAITLGLALFILGMRLKHAGDGSRGPG